MPECSAVEPRESFAVRWERELAEQRARSEYGRTAADVRRLLPKARSVQIAVRTDRTGGAFYMHISCSALRGALKLKQPDEIMPCEFDPVERRLTIGSLDAIDRTET